MYCIFQSCIRFAILISLSNSNVSAEKKKKIKSLSIEKRKGCYLGAEELPQKAVRVIHAVHSSVTAGNNTEYFLEWCRESIG